MENFRFFFEFSVISERSIKREFTSFLNIHITMNLRKDSTSIPPSELFLIHFSKNANSNVIL